MWLKRLSDYILQNRLQAFLVIFVSAFVPVIGSISIIMVAFITLIKGATEGLMMLAAASIPITLTYWGSPNGTTITVMFWVLLASNIFTWILAVVLQRFASWRLVLECAAIAGLLGVLILHVAMPDLHTWWSTKFAEVYSEMQGVIGDSDQAIATQQMFTSLKYYATGMVITAIFFNVLLQIGLARWWQASIYNPKGFKPELLCIRLNYVLGVIFVIVLAMNVWNKQHHYADYLPILYLIFALAGLSLIHDVLGRVKRGEMWLFFLYFLFALASAKWPAAIFSSSPRLSSNFLMLAGVA